MRYAGCILTCVSGDTKPTGQTWLTGWRAVETDTGKVYYNAAGTTWTEISGPDVSETLSGKTISGASNTITNVGKTSLPATTVYTDQANTYSDTYAQTFHSSYLKIYNPAASKAYTIVSSAIGDNYNATLPALTASDTFTFNEFTTTLKNKTITAADNTITDTSAATGDILHHNGTRFVRMAKGTAYQVLRTKSDASDIEYASLNAETTGTATGTANGSDTDFNIAHSLGSSPYCAFVQVSSVLGSTIHYSYTYDATNITVKFASAPAAGTITFQFRAVA